MYIYFLHAAYEWRCLAWNDAPFLCKNYMIALCVIVFWKKCEQHMVSLSEWLLWWSKAFVIIDKSKQKFVDILKLDSSK